MGTGQSTLASVQEDNTGHCTRRLHGRSDDYPHKKFCELTAEELFDPHHAVVDRSYTYDEVVNARTKMGNAYLSMKLRAGLAVGVAVGAGAVALAYFVRYTLVAIVMA